MINDEIKHALRIVAAMGRGTDSILAHINPHEAALLKKFGGSGKINPKTGLIEFDDGEGGGEAASPWSAAAQNDQPSQNESLNAFIGREDPQRYTDPESNRLTAEERSPSEREGQAHFVPSGEGQSLVRDSSGEISVAPSANQIATEQANQEENRAMAANAAMAQRAGVMTGQSEAPTFTGNTTEEQQLKDAEASQQAAINAAITGANYTAPGTVSAAEVATPVQSNIASNTGPFADTANRYTTAATTGAANLGDMARMLERQGAITSATGTPLQSLAAVQPATTTSTNPIDSSEAARNAQFQERVTRNLGEYSGDTIAKVNSVFNPNSYYGYTPASQQAAINAVLNSGQPAGQSVIDNTPLEASALYKAATFEPSQNAALRAARDAITQDMGKPETSYPAPVAQKVSGFNSSSPADLPASSTPTTSVSSQNILDKIFGSTQDQIDKLAAAGQYAGMDKQQYADQFAGGDINAVKERIINQDGQQKVDYYTKDLSQALFGDPLKAISTGIGNLFAPKPSYDPTAIGNGMGNIQGVSPSNNMTSPFGGHGGGPQQVLAGPVAAPAAATPVAAPIVPGAPVPFTYAQQTPYLDYGAYGAGLGNISPFSYGDPINWSLVPGYRASGGKVSGNNALANAIRLLAMQNRS